MKKLLIAVSMVALMGAGCAASTPSPMPNAEKPVAPEGKMSMGQFMTGSWKMKSIQMVGGQARDVSALGLTAKLDGEKMNGKICNTMNGPYTVEDNLVKFGAVMQTKMFCEGLPGEVESAFTSGFTTNYTISKQGENLVMQGAAVFVFERDGASGTEDGKMY